jgi:ligand-binding sensor domain-containing protein/signal transduction histidine kinase/CheY-like chemotaxis protein
MQSKLPACAGTVMQKNSFSKILALLPLWACYLFALLWTTSAFAATSPKKVAQYNLRAWRSEEGLPQNSVNSILQTSDGYIWLATFGGLTRFNGITFQVFGSGQGLKSNRIWSLTETDDGTLWIVTDDGGLSQYKQGEFRTLTGEDGLPNRGVQSVYEDSKGNLWICTRQGLIRWKDGQAISYTTANGLSSNNIHCVLEDRKGNLWIGTWDGGLAKLSGEKFTIYAKKEGLPNPVIKNLLEDRDGHLWVGTHGGICRFKDGVFTSYTVKQGLTDNYIGSLLQDKNGNIWIGTPKGLNRLKDGIITPYTVADGLTDNAINSLYEDKEGNLWIGTNVGGLNQLRIGNLTAYGQEEGLPANSIVPIIEDKEGAFWIGSNCDGLIKFQSGIFTPYTKKEELPNSCVWSLHQDRRGSLWIGTFGRGLVQFKDGEFVTYLAKDGLSSNVVFSIYEDRTDALWVGTDDGLNRFKDGKFNVYRVKDGLVNERVHYITEDRQGSLFIGTEGGFSRFKDEKFSNYTVKDGLSNNYVRDVYEDRDGTLWIGTYGGGLNRFKDGKFIHYTVNNGLFDDIVSRILEDEADNLWMTGNKGIYRVSRKELNDFADGKLPSITSISFGVLDGMKNNECNGGGQPAGWKSREGKLWFPTLKGIVVIDPKNINPIPPPVVIEKVLVNKTLVDLNKNVEILPVYGDLEIHYTGLSFVAPEKVRFKYKLEGFDKGWVDAGPRRVAYYTNIPPGQYSFQVIASNNDGIWNETGTSFEVYLKPRFYQTYPFYVLCVLTVVLSGIGLHRLRIKKLEARQKELTSLVEERTRAEAALRENHRYLEEALHQLGMAQQQIIEQERLRALGQMASGIAHDFNNTLLPILGYTDLMLQYPKNLDDKAKIIRNLNLISIAAKDAAKTVSRLREFYRANSKNETFLRVDLNQLIEKALLLTQPRWKDQAQAKGVTINVETRVQDELFVPCDESDLRETLINLIFNAVDAMPEGGTLTIRAFAEERNVVIEVSDTGVGMNEEVRWRCLEPFFSTKGERGTGLGLPMVYGTIQRHKGTIEIDTEPDQGTTIRLRLPIWVENATKEISAQETKTQTISLRVLIVDDEPQIRNVLAECLTGDGHKVETASHGREGLDKFLSGDFDLIMTDMAMPELSGDKMAKAIKQANPNVPIILLTGFGDIMKDADERPEGVDMILTKPVSVADLRRAIVKAMQDRT